MEDFGAGVFFAVFRELELEVYVWFVSFPCGMCGKVESMVSFTEKSRI